MNQHRLEPRLATYARTCANMQCAWRTLRRWPYLVSPERFTRRLKLHATPVLCSENHLCICTCTCVPIYCLGSYCHPIMFINAEVVYSFQQFELCHSNEDKVWGQISKFSLYCVYRQHHATHTDWHTHDWTALTSIASIVVMWCGKKYPWELMCHASVRKCLQHVCIVSHAHIWE